MEYGPCHDANDDLESCWRYGKTTARHEIDNRRKPKPRRTFGASKAGIEKDLGRFAPDTTKQTQTTRLELKEKKEGKGRWRGKAEGVLAYVWW